MCVCVMVCNNRKSVSVGRSFQVSISSALNLVLLLFFFY